MLPAESPSRPTARGPDDPRAMHHSPDSLRLGFVSPGTSGHIGPYLEFFSGRGHEVTWFAFDAPVPDHGVRTFDVSLGAHANCSRQKWKYLLAGLKVRRHLRRIPLDVLYAHYATSSGLIAWLSGFRPLVIRVQGGDVLVRSRSRAGRALLRLVLGRAALVHVVSAQLANAVRSIARRDVDLIEVTTGIAVEKFRFRVPQVERRPMRILCTRTLGPVYDPQTIVGACRELHRQRLNFRLTFAAGGPLEKGLRAEVARLGLDALVHFRGGFARADLPALLEAHDLYVSASLSDGTSISLLEAMAAGLFPVVSCIQSNSEWLEDGVSCLMFDCGQADMLAAQIQQAAQRSSFCRDAAVRNRQLVEREGDQQKNLSLVESELRKVVQAGNALKTYGR